MYSILIVDDEKIILDGLKSTISGAGLPFSEVCTASSAREALAAYEKSPFDVVLTDISMPQSDGLEMVRKMRRIWSHSIILFLTGYQRFDYAREAVRLQGFDYLLKPIADEELLCKLQEVVSKLNAEWDLRFEQETAAIRETDENVRKVSDLLKSQYLAKRWNFSTLQESGLPFDRNRKIRILTIYYEKAAQGEGAGQFHEKLTSIISKMAYGYGYLSGFQADENTSVFLIQKSAVSETMFAGVYNALEEMQSYFFTELNQKMTIIISHQCAWDDWILLAEKMIRQIKTDTGFGIFGKYEEQEDPGTGNVLMYKIREYILGNPGADLSLGALSGKFHINPSYLSRSFHAEIRIPLSQFILETRLNAAKTMLLDSDKKIFEIAREVGFETQGYFTKVFSRETGMTPKQYRQEGVDNAK